MMKMILIFFSCTYKTIKNVTQAIDDFHFNIAIANIRTLFNELNLYKAKTNNNKIIKKILYFKFPYFIKSNLSSYM